MPGDLLQRVRGENYRTWARAPGYPERTPSNGPHGGSVDIYVNDVVSAALASGAIDEWPVGSVIVKDGFSDDEPLLTAIMQKQVDGWIWAEYYAGDRKYEGPVSVCTNCHASGDDYVRAFPFPERG